MNNLNIVRTSIPAMSEKAIAAVCQIENEARQLPQASIATLHTLHGGVYTRTIKIPAGIMITGALIKVPTTLVMTGDVVVYIDQRAVRMAGHNVLPASAHRKQAFVAVTDTYLTMAFGTNAKTVQDAENEFTDDADLLISRHPDAQNYVNVTGE